MTDIWITLESFAVVVAKDRYSGTIFESRGYLITSCKAITLIAKKNDPKKIYSESIPFYRFGYVSIAFTDTSLIKESDSDDSAPLVTENN